MDLSRPATVIVGVIIISRGRLWLALLHHSMAMIEKGKVRSGDVRAGSTKVQVQGNLRVNHGSGGGMRPGGGGGMRPGGRGGGLRSMGIGGRSMRPGGMAYPAQNR